MSKNAYSLLAEISDRSQKNAASVPEKQKVKSTWSGIGFRMGGDLFVAPMSEISEVIEIPAYTILPGVKSWVKGIANVRGRLLPVMDLVSFFRVTKKKREPFRRIIVIDRGDTYSGLLVDEVLGMQHFPTEIYRERVESCSENIDPFIRGAYFREDSSWRLFSLNQLAEDPRFLDAAS